MQSGCGLDVGMAMAKGFCRPVEKVRVRSGGLRIVLEWKIAIICTQEGESGLLNRKGMSEIESAEWRSCVYL